MKRLIALCVISIALMSAAGAVSADDLRTDFGAAVDEYNDNADQIPSAFAMLVRNERINVEIEYDNETVVYGIEMDGKTISDWQRGGLDKPTVTVYTSASTIDRIVTADNPRKEAIKAKNDGDIRFTTHKWLKKVEFFVLGVLSWIAGLF